MNVLNDIAREMAERPWSWVILGGLLAFAVLGGNDRILAPLIERTLGPALGRVRDAIENRWGQRGVAIAALTAAGLVGALVLTFVAQDIARAWDAWSR